MPDGTVRVVGFGVFLVAAFTSLWWMEAEMLAHQQARSKLTVAVRDLAIGEYVTAAHVTGTADAAILGKQLKTAKRKGDVLTAKDIAPMADAAIVPIVFGAERSLGGALRVGLCVEVWSAGPPPALVAQGVTVVTVLPVAPDGRRQVFLAVPIGGQAGALLTAKEPALAIARACSQTATAGTGGG